MTPQYVALDLETKRFGIEHSLLPPPICYACAWMEGEELKTWLLGNGDEGVELFLERLFRNPEVVIVTQSGSYDTGVIAEHHPRLAEAVYLAYRQGRIKDVGVREKLNAIATRGKLREDWDEEGSPVTVKYGLADFVQEKFGVDRSAAKHGSESVRTRYDELDGLRADQYPAAYREYALQDAIDTLYVFLHQEEHDCHTATEELQVAADLALRHASHRGLKIDEEETARLEKAVAVELVPEKQQLLLAEEILRPGHNGLPAENGARAHVDGCDRFGCDCAAIQPKRKAGEVVGWQRKHAKGCERPKCDCPPQITQPKPPSIFKAKLHARVLDICKAKRLEVVLSDKGQEMLGGAEKLPPETWDTDYRLRDPKNGKPLYVSVAGEFLHELAAHDPVLREYRHRARLDKLKQFLERLRAALDAGYPYMHPGYDLLKETARTASFGGKKGAEIGSEENPVPGLNIQQAPNPPKVSREGLEFLDEIDVRAAFEPRPGMVFINADFGSMELVTAAQVSLDLFGFSRHAEILNSGRNCHTYLGASVLHDFGDGRSKPVAKFREFADVRRAVRLGDRVYLHDVFKKYATGTDTERKCFKRYRTTAKPLGLGFWGALGARKMAYGIFPQYNLESTEAECVQFKALWLDAYPEAPLFFDHVQKSRRDPEHPGRYWYESWAGFKRVNCSYNAAANGESMQTPGAMAAKLALVLLDQAANDPAQCSILYRRFFLNLFVHDEAGGETFDDPLAHYVAEEVGRLMVKALGIICPDVEGTAEPLLTRRWCKDAEPTFDEFGRHIPWTPKRTAS